MKVTLNQLRSCSSRRWIYRIPYIFTALSEDSSIEAADGLRMAPSAIDRLRELQKESPESTLRVVVEGGGCSGFQYKFIMDGRRKEDDILFENEGARLLCDPLSLQFLKGATVEFSDTLMRSSFQIKENPNSETSCGCGTSFSVKEMD